MATLTDDVRVTALRARPVSVPLDPPLQTASGELGAAPLVLIDLETDAGITGHSYLLAYTPLALRPLAALVEELGAVVNGEPLAPRTLAGKIAARFRLLGPKGLPTIALAGVDMAAWDAFGKVADTPVYRLLGGSPTPIPGYGSLRAMGADDAGREAAGLAEFGFRAYKGRVGRQDTTHDFDVVRALRASTPEGSRIALDFNQSLSVAEALPRLQALAGEDLLWVEEPTRAEDFAAHAEIRRRAPMPIQFGENWWGTVEMAASLQAGASDLAMIDVMRIGGVTGWLHAAGIAEAANIPLSSHLFPEVSVHLLAVTPTAHYLEYLDLASSLLQNPLRPVDGHVTPPDTPGFGIEWDEDAVSRVLVS